MYLLLNMVIFHCYVSFPERIWYTVLGCGSSINRRVLKSELFLVKSQQVAAGFKNPRVLNGGISWYILG